MNIFDIIINNEQSSIDVIGNAIACWVEMDGDISFFNNGGEQIMVLHSFKSTFIDVYIDNFMLLSGNFSYNNNKARTGKVFSEIK